MAINQIALLAQTPEFETPLESQGKALHIRQLMNQNRMDDLTFSEKQRDSEQSTALNNIYRAAMGADGQVDRNKLYSGVAAGGLGSKLPGIQKQFLETDDKVADIAHKGAQTKDLTATTSGKEYDLSEKKRQKAVADIAAFNSPADAMASLEAHVKAGDLDPQSAAALRSMVPQNPADFPKWQIGMLKRIMSPKEAAGYTAPDSNTLASNATSRANNAATVAATVRGQNMADTRAKEALEAGKSQIVQSDNGPVLVNTRTGAGRTVMGPDGQPLPGVTKPLNEGQSKALLFGTRMQEADKVLAQLATEGTTTSVPGSGTGYGIGTAVNAVSSGNRQMLNQAKRDFMNAVLRRESGAAISAGEFDSADKQYFPQLGDSAAVIAQKAKNRQLAISGVLVEVPEKQRASITPKAAVAPAQVTDAASYAKIPSGAEYITPDGHTRRKP